MVTVITVTFESVLPAVEVTGSPTGEYPSDIVFTVVSDKPIGSREYWFTDAALRRTRVGFATVDAYTDIVSVPTISIADGKGVFLAVVRDAVGNQSSVQFSTEVTAPVTYTVTTSGSQVYGMTQSRNAIYQASIVPAPIYALVLSTESV